MCALVFRGGPLLRLFGMDVVRRDGLPASRARCLGRALAAWSPVVGGAIASASVGLLAVDRLLIVIGLRTGSSQTLAWVGVCTFFALLFVAGVVYAALHPERGMQDRIAGTVLVPR